MQQRKLQKIGNLLPVSNLYSNLVLLCYKHFRQINNGGFMRNIFLFAFLLLISYAKTFAIEIEYLYPKANTDKHSIETPIIIRFNENVQLEKIIGNIEIKGEISGHHKFKASLSDDKRTISIRTENRFAPSEQVHLGIFGKDYNFKTTRILPVEQRKVFAEHFATQYPEIFNVLNAQLDEPKETLDNPLADTVPSDFPTVIINSVNNPAPGYIYIANFGMGAERSYLMILDNEGKPVKYRKVPVPGFDFKMQPNGLITNAHIITSHIPQGWGWAEAYMEVMGKDLNVIDTVQCQGGYIADFHDFKMLPNGHYLLQAYDPQPIDMSEIVEGGNPNAIVLGSIVQELDANKNVVFQWRSWDHIRLTETYATLTGIAIDPVHINAVELDYDGNILISSRHLSEITKISRATGAIIWRLGGLQNSFKFINEHEENAPTYFSYQHDIRRLPNGNITLYDNGNQHNPPYSRAVEYKLDEDNMTATLVWEYRNSPDIFGETMGSVQRLPNGNTLIGWGGVTGNFYRNVTEVTPNNEVAFELSFPKGVSFQTTSYRAYRFPYPPGDPEAVVKKERISDILYKKVPPTSTDTIHFSDVGMNTGVSIYFEKLTDDSLSFIQVERYPYAPLYPKFYLETPLVNTYRVVISSNHIQEFKGKIIFDLNTFPQLIHKRNIAVWRKSPNNDYFSPILGQTYNSFNNTIIYDAYSLDGEYIFATGDYVETPLRPTLTNPSDSSILNKENKITFQWTPEGWHQFSEIQVAEDADFTNIVFSQDSLKTTIIEIPPLPEGKTYFWRVRSYGKSRWSPWSYPFTFEVKAPFVSLISPNGGEVWEKGKTELIQWKHNLDNAFIITLYLNNNPLTNITDTVYSVYGKYYWSVPENLPADTKYKVRVTSYSDNTRFSESQAFFTITDASFVGNGASNNIEIFPNPVENQLYINIRELDELPISLKIVNIFGETVSEYTITSISNELHAIDLTNLYPGIYFINYTTHKSSYRLKLLKIN